jgi:hypothetical protein
MSSTGVRLGIGTVVRIGRGAGPTWTTLTGGEDVVLPDMTRADEDVTSMDSPNETEEFIPGLRTAADWSMTKHYVPDDAEDVLLYSIEATKELVILSIQAPGAALAQQWQGYVKKWLPTMPVKGAMKGEIMMKIMARIVAEATGRRGMGTPELMQIMTSNGLSAVETIALIHAMLQEYHPDVTERQAGRLALVALNGMGGAALSAMPEALPGDAEAAAPEKKKAVTRRTARR